MMQPSSHHSSVPGGALALGSDCHSGSRSPGKREADADHNQATRSGIPTDVPAAGPLVVLYGRVR